MAAISQRGAVWNNRETFAAAVANQKGRYAVYISAAGVVSTVATANDTIAIGIQEEDTLFAGDPASVIESGHATALAGAAIGTAGTLLKTDATGRLVPVAATGDVFVAKALETAAAANDELLVLVTHGTYATAG